MRSAVFVAILLGAGSSFVITAAVPPLTAADRPGTVQRRPPIKPAPPIVQPPIVPRKFTLRVQEKPRFPNAADGEASVAVTEQGLSLTVQPERATFNGNGPLAFRVTLTNTTEQPRMLFNTETLGATPKLVITNTGTAAQWTLTLPEEEKIGGRSTLVQPGKSVEMTLVVEADGKPIAIPRPIPRPRPLPFEKGTLQVDAAAGKPQPLARDRRRPAVIIAQPTLPCGTGKCRAIVLLEFKANPARIKLPHRHWVGRIASRPVDFTVGPAQGQPPIIGPPRGPLTEAQAIERATAVAERALKANYRSAPPLQPAHTGTWIESPEKSATVKNQADGSWRISWTHFTRNKGFNYNVSVVVNANGNATLKEVFTSYSPGAP